MADRAGGADSRRGEGAIREPANARRGGGPGARLLRERGRPGRAGGRDRREVEVNTTGGDWTRSGSRAARAAGGTAGTTRRGRASSPTSRRSWFTARIPRPATWRRRASSSPSRRSTTASDGTRRWGPSPRPSPSGRTTKPTANDWPRFVGDSRAVGNPCEFPTARQRRSPHIESGQPNGDGLAEGGTAHRPAFLVAMIDGVEERVVSVSVTNQLNVRGDSGCDEESPD